MTTALSATQQPDSGRKGAHRSHPQAALEKQNKAAPKPQGTATGPPSQVRRSRTPTFLG